MRARSRTLDLRGSTLTRKREFRRMAAESPSGVSTYSRVAGSLPRSWASGKKLRVTVWGLRELRVRFGASP